MLLRGQRWPWGLHALTRGLAVDHQDVGHLRKLNAGGVLLNFFQEFSKDHFAPASERRRRDIAARAGGASTQGGLHFELVRWIFSRGWRSTSSQLSAAGGTRAGERRGNVLPCGCRPSAGVGCARTEGPGGAAVPPALHSHFPNLFAVVAQNLKEAIQDLWQIIQQVDVWHGLQNQDLTQGKKSEGQSHRPAREPAPPPQCAGPGQREGPAEAALHGTAGVPWWGGELAATALVTSAGAQ